MAKIPDKWIHFGVGFGLGWSMGTGIHAFVANQWVHGDFNVIQHGDMSLNETNTTISNTIHSGLWSYCVEGNCASTIGNKLFTDDSKFLQNFLRV